MVTSGTKCGPWCMFAHLKEILSTVKAHLGSAYEGDSHTQLPLHAARERARLLVALVLKVQQNQHFFYIFIHVLAAF